MIAFTLIVLSVISPFLIITPTAFPFIGIALFFILLATLLLSLKKEKSFSDYLYYGFILASSAFIVLRSNPFLIFLNIVSTIYFGSLLIAENKKGQNFGIFSLIFLPFLLFLEFLNTKNIFPLELKNLKRGSFERKKIRETLFSLLITVAVIGIIVPLLASANPIFDNWVNTFINALNIGKLVDRLFGDYLPLHIIRLIFVTIFIFLLPRIASYINTNQEPTHHGSEMVFPLLMAKLLTVVILVLFFTTQIQLYMATSETLQALSLTHSQYAREVFAQLCVVALIIFGLIYMDKSHSRFAKILTYMLVVEGIFLTSIALKSVYDYSQTFGFTHKRLWGYTGVAWMLGTFGLFIYNFQRNDHHQKLMKNIAIYSGFILLSVNIANFDYLIYHYKKSATGEGIDQAYLTRTLSSDADSYSEQLVTNYQILQQQEIPNVIPTYEILRKIEDLQNKYKKLDIRTFNLSEYRAYQNVKNISIKKYEDSIQEIIKKIQPQKPIPIKVNNGER